MEVRDQDYNFSSKPKIKIILLGLHKGRIPNKALKYIAKSNNPNIQQSIFFTLMPGLMSVKQIMDR